MKNPREYVPEINMDSQNGVLYIGGESYHEYTQEFFLPIMEWLDSQMAHPGRRLEINFKMTYFNTSSARIFLELMQRLEKYQNQNQGQVLVNWHYESNDIDMYESGLRYSEDVRIPFNLVKF